MAQLDFHALSHRGMVRPENQDHVFAGRISRTDERYLFAVADGVGGREGGAWASERTLQLLMQEISVPGVGFQAAIMAANRSVYEEASKSTERNGAATTLTAVLVEGTAFTWANVGDSRGYILRGGQLHQLTRDHSLVEEEIEAGRLTREEAAKSPHRNVITRSIGHQPAVDVDSKGPFQLEPGDMLLLCSDGLHQLVSTDEMTEYATTREPAAATDGLIRLANERGSPDNVSVVIAAFGREAPKRVEAPVSDPPAVEEDLSDTYVPGAPQRTARMQASEAALEPQLAAPETKPVIRVVTPTPQPEAPPQSREPVRVAPPVSSAPPPPPPAAREARQPQQISDDEDGPRSAGANVRMVGFFIFAALFAGLVLGITLKPF
jgi:protein phosphatase